LGKEAAVIKKAQKPMTRRLAQVLVKDPKPLLFHAEVVSRNGKEVGYVRAGSYGFSLGGAVGLFMIEAGEAVNADYIADGNWEIEIAGEKYPAQVSLKPFYDPDMKKIKA